MPRQLDFGRMVRIRRYIARSTMPFCVKRYERQFVYVYAAVSPIEGEMDWMISQKMNTEQMSAFLSQVSAAHPEDFIVMVLDGASSHKAKELKRPENIMLIGLPPYSRNSIHKNMYGMSSERKSSQTGYSTILTQ